MSIIKEYREFFLRNIPVATGTKPDKELNYPVSYLAKVNNVFITAFNRFLKDNIPSENMYEKLFESLTFKLNTEDTATSTTQGLVSIATLDELNASTDLDSNSFQLVPQPSDVKNVITTDIATHAALTATHGVAGDIVGTTDAQSLTNKSITIKDNSFQIINDTDITKVSSFSNSYIIAGTSIILYIPNNDGVIITNNDNKTVSNAMLVDACVDETKERLRDIISLADADNQIITAPMIINDSIISVNLTASRSYTTASNSDFLNGLPDCLIGTCVTFTIINLTPANYIATITGGANVSIVGKADIVYGTSGLFQLRYGGGSVTIYRIS